MKKAAVIVCGLVLIFGLAFYFTIIKSSVDVDEVRSRVVEHLNTKGLKDTEYSLEVSYHWENKLLGYNPYAVKVIFRDEPNVVYYYDYHYRSSDKKVTQRGVAPTDSREDKNFKHSE